MPRTVLASELLARLRAATDTERDSHVSDQELYRNLTSAVAETWDKVLENGLGGEYVKTVYLTATAGTVEYPLSSALWRPTVGGTAAVLADLYKVKTLYVSDGNGLWRPVERVAPSEEYGLRGPTQGVSLKLCYVPSAPVFTTGSEVFDGINGWEEHTIQLAAIAVKAKKEDDTGQYRARAREIEERMRTHANRNADTPPRVIRRRNTQRWAARTLPYFGGVGAWDLRALTLELYSPQIGLFP